MKKTRNFVVALLFLLLTLFPGFMPKNREAKALSSNYFLHFDSDNVYYFSDSTPAFKDVYEANNTLVPVTYDIHPLMTNQELAFLLYSGYFWGFNQLVNNTVIIEIKSAMPDPIVLMNLFICLQEQGCKVMFISSYLDELDSSILEYTDVSMQCNMDKYSRYLKNAVKGMLGNDGILRNGTSVLMSGKFFGLNEVEEIPPFADLIRYSPTLKRLLLNMYYNCDKQSEPLFEETLYMQIWQYMQQNFFMKLGWNSNYFEGDTDINNYISNWQNLANSKALTPWEYYASETENYSGYLVISLTSLVDYYSDIVSQLLNREIFIWINNYQCNFFNLMNYYFSEVEDETPIIDNSKQFTTISNPSKDYSKVPNIDGHYVYSMGITRLTEPFLDLLNSIQNVMPNTEKYSKVNRIPYIWEDDPIVWGGSLIIMVEDEMQATYGDGCGGCSECLNLGAQVQEDMFLQLLDNLLD